MDEILRWRIFNLAQGVLQYHLMKYRGLKAFTNFITWLTRSELLFIRYKDITEQKFEGGSSILKEFSMRKDTTNDSMQRMKKNIVKKLYFRNAYLCKCKKTA